jgi:hypothetical protein
MPLDDTQRRGGRGEGPAPAKNVLGGTLLPCSVAPLTGFSATAAATPGRTTSACMWSARR